MQESIDVTERMRSEWNERAREDAHFYVAFGRREQDDDEFFADCRGSCDGPRMGTAAIRLRMQIAAPGERSRSVADPAG